MSIHLRELRETDAPYMLEWMHDEDIQKSFYRDMLHVTLEEAEHFCMKASRKPDMSKTYDRHWAIADEEDEYLGTISLKKIDLKCRRAEYAIVLRKKTQGLGIGTEATKEVLRIAFDELNLHRVYLTVIDGNDAAIHMYESCGFVYEGMLRDHLIKDGIYHGWRLYGILKDEYKRL